LNYKKSFGSQESVCYKNPKGVLEVEIPTQCEGKFDMNDYETQEIKNVLNDRNIMQD